MAQQLRMPCCEVRVKILDAKAQDIFGRSEIPIFIRTAFPGNALADLLLLARVIHQTDFTTRLGFEVEPIALFREAD